MADTFYRFHWADCPEFSEGNAWSVPWGERERSEDGTQIQCEVCDGSGFDTAENEECGQCSGTGWEAADRGYSCCRSAADLLTYFSTEAHHGGPPADDHGRVIEFRGEFVGNGCDGEPLAVPTGTVESLTWSEFVTHHAGAIA